MKVQFSEKLKTYLPNLCLGVLSCDIEIREGSKELEKEISSNIIKLQTTINREEIKNIPVIKEIREVYKILKINPDRYPASSEALLKRVVLNKGLSNINNVVDINNLFSLRTFLPIGTYDLDKIQGDILMKIGEEGDMYESLGKGLFKLERFPAFSDSLSVFGSTTSDSKRTAITLQTKRIITIIISFNSTYSLTEVLEFFKYYYVKFGNAKNINSFIES